MRSIDPTVIAQCVAAPEAAPELPDPAAEAWAIRRAEIREAQRAKLRTAMQRLPAAEAVGLRLCAEGMRQVDVGEALGMSQQRLSYRLARAQYRLRLAVDLPALDVDHVARALGTLTPRPLRPLVAAVMVDYWLTANASYTGRRLGMSERTAARYVARGIVILGIAASRRPELVPIRDAYATLRAWASILGARGREPAETLGSDY